MLTKQPDQPASALSELYKTDFHAWTRRAAELVRQHKLDALHLEDLAEEFDTGLSLCARRDPRSDLLSRRGLSPAYRHEASGTLISIGLQ
ncbi:DUF29 family protein [Thiocapsa rosea]|uniref:Uncharacterized protein DUF29 n=1 Tax=Thiocapsa rosea TaxID=69360 RepID=A0A495V2Z0_9GAMM|nr:DUF29 family protein [Thiocapsa rosea]RKT42945.1 uncharacterized protein DUF29 [Thiocapsa rosea]